jgi:hypothetical protein
MNILSVVKDGLKMGKDKAVNVISGVGTFLKEGKNRVIVGVVLGGLSVGLILSGYIKLPQ